MIALKNLSLILPHKICFENFETKIYDNDRIAITGRNGVGKSTLLKMIMEKIPTEEFFFIPQNITDNDNLSGGERFINKLREALTQEKKFLILDEPTNHLDKKNKSWLMKIIEQWQGTVIFVSHDVDLLRRCGKILWHIHDGKISIFKGSYDDYIEENKLQKEKIFKKLENIKHQQKEINLRLQQEQENFAKKKNQGKKSLKNKKWLKAVRDQKKSSSENCHGKIFKTFNEEKNELKEQLKSLFIPEKINFNFDLCGIKKSSTFSVINGFVFYEKENPILKNLNLIIDKNLCIRGENGSGKTTLLRALYGDEKIFREGEWNLPQQIIYIDQHYKILDEEKNAIEIISTTNKNLTDNELRKYLSDFGFRHNEICFLPSKFLSGGEKVRLCFAKICSSPCELLILDEITNNIDLETREYVIQILKNYKNKFIIVSHDEDFLQRIGIEDFFDL